MGNFFVKKKAVKKDFEFYIEEYLYYCQSRRLRPKTMSSSDQALRLFERIREELRNLIRFIPKKEGWIANTDMLDEILFSEWHDSELENDDLVNYKLKVNYYMS